MPTTKQQVEILKQHYYVAGYNGTEKGVQLQYIEAVLDPANMKLLKGRTGSFLRRDANQTSGFYGHPIYLGGSSLYKFEGGRDVDLFIILPCKDFVFRYLNNYESPGDSYEEQCQQWNLRYHSGMYDQGNWQWHEDMVKKSMQSMHRTNLMIDFKVLPINVHEAEYGHKPLLRIDTKADYKYFWPDEKTPNE